MLAFRVDGPFAGRQPGVPRDPDSQKYRVVYTFDDLTTALGRNITDEELDFCPSDYADHPDDVRDDAIDNGRQDCLIEVCSAADLMRLLEVGLIQNIENFDTGWMDDDIYSVALSEVVMPDHDKVEACLVFSDVNVLKSGEGQSNLLSYRLGGFGGWEGSMEGTKDKIGRYMAHGGCEIKTLELLLGACRERNPLIKGHLKCARAQKFDIEQPVFYERLKALVFEKFAQNEEWKRLRAKFLWKRVRYVALRRAKIGREKQMLRDSHQAAAADKWLIKHGLADWMSSKREKIQRAGR